VTAKGDESELVQPVARQNANSTPCSPLRAQRRSEIYWAEAQRLSHTGSFGWKPASGELIWSEETFRIFQYDPTIQPTTELVLRRVHPEDVTRVQQTLQRVAQQGKGYEHEYRLSMPDGSIKHVRVVARALSDEAGNVEFVGAVMDVTAARQLERTLREREAYLAEAQRLTHTGSGAWQVADDEAVYLSEEWYRIYGFDPCHGLSAWKERLPRMHPDDQAKVKLAKDEAIRNKSDYQVEHRIVLPDGTVKHTETVGHPVLNGSGEVEQFVCTMMDITDRTQAEQAREALRESQADLARISRVTTMGELTASLAHELNQPITAAVTDVRTCLRWLQREQPDLLEAREAASRAVKDATRAAELINRIRVLFRKATQHHELVDINEIVREMVILLHGETVRYNVAVGVDLAADLPQVLADRVQLQQVMMNLMINAIEAMKDTELRITHPGRERRPTQNKLLSTRRCGFLEDERDASERLRLIKQ